MVNGRQIAAARVWLGISQAELGLAAKVATRTIAHIEDEEGSRVPHDRTLQALVEALKDMGVEFVMDEKDASLGIGICVRHANIPQIILKARGEAKKGKAAK